jgi:hypothetical protein
MGAMQLPPTNPVNHRHGNDYPHQVDQLVYNGHGERIDRVEGFNVNGAVFVRKDVSGQLQEKVDTNSNHCSLQVCWLPQVQEGSLLLFFREYCLHFVELGVDLFVGKAALSQLSQSYNGILFPALQ